MVENPSEVKRPIQNLDYLAPPIWIFHNSSPLLRELPIPVVFEAKDLSYSVIIYLGIKAKKIELWKAIGLALLGAFGTKLLDLLAGVVR
ncbi:hypothetical protein RM69_00270 [Mesotoga sp. SC_NapDC3]|nr:hypothetical protein RM69_00270 [Mesotoga sp. SC_NapDC3]